MHTKRFITFLKIWVKFRKDEIPRLPFRAFISKINQFEEFR